MPVETRFADIDSNRPTHSKPSLRKNLICPAYRYELVAPPTVRASEKKWTKPQSMKRSRRSYGGRPLVQGCAGGGSDKGHCEQPPAGVIRQRHDERCTQGPYTSRFDIKK
jgi:hypothetical protein